MTQIKKLKRKALSWFLALAMVLSTFAGIVPSMGMTVQAAPAETLLTTITPTSTTTYSESTAGVVNVTLSDISVYDSGKWEYGGTVTVTQKEGYTITKCRFNARGGAVDDTEAPFSIDVGSATYVSSIEVYGYAPSAAVDKTALNTGITEAETLYNSIKDEAAYSEIASTLNTAIEAAKGVAESNTADQNAVDAATTAITTAKTNAEAAKKDVDDTTEANKVSTLIADLPAKEAITKDDNTKVEAAKAAYDALTDDQKKKVSEENKQKLDDAVAAIAAIEKKDEADTAAAKEVSDKISELPSKDAVKKEDKTAIEEAKAAFDALTDDQKAKVSDADKQKLNDAVAALAAIEKEEADTAAAKKVEDAINALPAADKVTANDKKAIEDARAAYDKLTSEQKKQIPKETVHKLEDAEKALAAAEKAAAEKAAKEKAAAEKAAKEKADAEAAAKVTKMINDLPAKPGVEDGNKVKEARKAYDALTGDQKKLVKPETVKKLEDAEKAVAKAIEEKKKADAEAAAKVTKKINALPKKLKLKDEKKVKAARKAYDALTDDQKKMVKPETLKKLKDAEKALKKVIQKAKKNKNVKFNKKTASKKQLHKRVVKIGASKKYIKTFTLGKKVKKIKPMAFKTYKKAKILVIKTKKLTKKSIKAALKGSKITKIKVKVGNKKMNKKFVKKYKKIFTKKNAGKKVKIV